ncbi:aldo/keto reductase [Methanocorpusculum sp.]|nr:aldo/keto reductase [Methanocorpusculum sp.]
MQYKEFKDLRLSALGFGAMRLPVIDGDESRIDEAAAAEMVDFAMKSGINYFDTAWGYHSENSETVMGRILKAYPRESFYLATKFPGYDPENLNRMEEIFSRQMEKLQTDYFDFYLVHNVCEVNIEYYLNPDLMEFLREQKAAGKIRHLGFSVHGTLETMKRFLEAFSEEMEFCQIQLNWFDWEFQDAKAKVELLREYGIPFIVMEPLRGGKLASLPADAEEKLKALRPDETIPA